MKLKLFTTKIYGLSLLGGLAGLAFANHSFAQESANTDTVVVQKEVCYPAIYLGNGYYRIESPKCEESARAINQLSNDSVVFNAFCENMQPTDCPNVKRTRYDWDFVVRTKMYILK